MTDAEETLFYWKQAYADDLAKNRDPAEFGMRWMAYQIAEWEAAVEKESAAT